MVYLYMLKLFYISNFNFSVNKECYEFSKTGGTFLEQEKNKLLN